MGRTISLSQLFPAFQRHADSFEVQAGEIFEGCPEFLSYLCGRICWRHTMMVWQRTWSYLSEHCWSGTTRIESYGKDGHICSPIAVAFSATEPYLGCPNGAERRALSAGSFLLS